MGAEGFKMVRGQNVGSVGLVIWDEGRLFSCSSLYFIMNSCI